MILINEKLLKMYNPFLYNGIESKYHLLIINMEWKISASSSEDDPFRASFSKDDPFRASFSKDDQYSV